ncbi:MAG: hypothetical protein HY319_26100 [Armatimonadetes bacterium]|nr:hypothetical protein [Armatimonadota bacterium]
MRRILSILCVLLFALAGPSAAQMAELLREEFHEAEELGIVVVEEADLNRLEGIIANDKTRVLALQVMGNRFSAEHAGLVLEWVRKGHSLLVYDARLLSYFGMKPLLIEPEQFRWKPEKGQIGGHKHHGVATVALAIRAHEVNTGVGQCTLFLPNLGADGEERYGAVEVLGDTVPLLQFTADSPALSALRREGRGLIVYKPLLWPLALSGERFQSNLLEFAAGFQIPGPAGEGKLGNPPGPNAEYVQGNPAIPLAGSSSEQPSVAAAESSASGSPSEPRKGSGPKVGANPAVDPGTDLLQVYGSDDVTGSVLNKDMRFETGSSSITFDRTQVKTLHIGSTIELDRLVMRDGTVHKGLLLTQELHVGTPQGEKVLEKSDLKCIEFGEPAK